MFHVFFSLGGRWYWQKLKLKPYVDFMKRNYPPGFKYQDFAPMFTAEFFDAKEWTEIFASSGAKYIVLTTKHHEGPRAPWTSCFLVTYIQQESTNTVHTVLCILQVLLFGARKPPGTGTRWMLDQNGIW